MKTLLLFLFLSLSMFAQEIKSISKGTITTVAIQKIEFINLRAVDGQIIFRNAETNTDFTYFKNSIKSITDENGNLVYSASEEVVKSYDDQMAKLKLPNTDSVSKFIKSALPLEFRGSSKIVEGQKKLSKDEVRQRLGKYPDILKSYDSGSSTLTVGNIMFGGGLGFAIGAGLANMTSANQSAGNYGQTASKSAGPALIIVGLVVTVVSIPILLSGKQKMRKSIERYNGKVKGFTATDIRFNLNGNGLGLSMGF